MLGSKRTENKANLNIKAIQ